VARNVEVRVLEDEYSTGKSDHPLIPPGSSYQIYTKLLEADRGAKTLRICDSTGEEVACIAVEPSSVSRLIPDLKYSILSSENFHSFARNYIWCLLS